MLSSKPDIDRRPGVYDAGARVHAVSLWLQGGEKIRVAIRAMPAEYGTLIGGLVVKPHEYCYVCFLSATGILNKLYLVLYNSYQRPAGRPAGTTPGGSSAANFDAV
jgi:hypothetical protein